MAVAGPARFPEKRSRLCSVSRGQEVDVPVVVVIAPRQLDRPFHPPSLLDRQCRLVVAENHIFAAGAVLGTSVDIDVGADARRLDSRDRHQHARALERRFVAEAGAKRPAAAEEVAIAQVGRHAAGGDPLVEQRLVLVRRFEAVQEQEAARLLDGDHGVNGHQGRGRRRRRRGLERHFGGPEGADVIELASGGFGQLGAGRRPRLNPRRPFHQRVARALDARGAHRLHQVERALVHAGDDVHPPRGRIHLRLGFDRGVPVSEVAVMALHGESQGLFASGDVSGAHREPGRRDGLLLSSDRHTSDRERRDPRDRSFGDSNRQRGGVALEGDGRCGGFRAEISAGRVCGLHRLQQRRRVLPRLAVQIGLACEVQQLLLAQHRVARERQMALGRDRAGVHLHGRSELIGDRLVYTRLHAGAQVAETSEMIADDQLEIGSDQVHEPRCPPTSAEADRRAPAVGRSPTSSARCADRG